ncbi:MAG: hypothetical protein HY804_13720 [Nitrospinae bacterium]|nr:hypothetical protein [Nitrospinota bacterium]
MLDTLEYANELKAAGVPEKQAEVQAKALARVAEDNLATKRDLKEVDTSIRGELVKVESSLRGEIAKVESSLRGEIAKVESSLRGEINQLRAEMNGKFTLLYWMIGFNLAFTAAMLMKIVF